MKVDVIIPVYNQLEYTKRCLWAIEANTFAPYGLVFVDNGSTDGSGEWMLAVKAGHEDATVGLVEIITNHANLGFAKAVNMGIVASDSPYIVLLNNDTEVPQGWLTALIEAMEADPRIGAMGVLSTAKAQGTWEGNFEDVGVQIFANKYSLGQLPYFCAILRRKALDDVGLLDEEFFLYGEDDDLNLRLMQAGWKLALHTGVVVKHKHGATATPGGFQRYRKSARKRLMEKWGEKTMLVCIMRVKDEEDRIRRCLDSMPFVDKFIVVDNGSTDDTVTIVGEYPSTVLHTEGVDAPRDLNLAYQEALRQGATHVLWMDADEEWEARAAEEFPKMLAQDVAAWTFRVYPFVLSKTHYRVDGPWAQFTEQGQTRLFQAQKDVFWKSERKAHAGLPRGLKGLVGRSDLRIKHWTIETPEEAERKVAFYEAADGKDYGHLRDGPGAELVEWVERVRTSDPTIPAYQALLYAIVRGTEAQLVYEIGVRDGYSTRAILEALDKTGGRLVSCDIADCQAVIQDEDLRQRWTFWHGTSEDMLYRESWRETPRTRKLLRIEADVIYIDGSHEHADVKADVVGMWPLLKVGGVMILHDTLAFPDGPGRVLTWLQHRGIEAINLPFRNGFGVVHKTQEVLLDDVSV